ncbi:deoxyribodipyrimidine photo-lyase (single-stranded DNA-specific) [Halothece sp. PCC 7418]|uniref:DASH family cryptochrome n=1 Tax=Halothece sp. (strain PCC 7418) TaxID=65093 RepID=UPI0002A0618C|nr:DASH family cryptochrome [Halothece sp. PCC 7418]AFZ44377.1 deoxyribodipyrimidine photo-lyase (single-stranded DNA-specific) [Halothece sp. PCC 7418]
MSQQKILIWYRNDLRVHDHEPLFRASKTQGQIIPFYCFDTREFGHTGFGFPKTGSFRAQFLQESVANLRETLKNLGSNLMIRVGQPEIIIPELVTALNLTNLVYHAEVTAEEIRVEKALSKQLQSLGVTLTSYWGSTLHHLDDLPIKVDDLPDVFTQYRKRIEKTSEIRSCFPTPEKLPPLPSEIATGDLPNLETLGVKLVSPDERGVLKFVGGERAGLDRLKDYIWQEDCLKVYKKTRNGMLGTNDSSKFSPWLARGCLSPRYVYEEVQSYEENRVKNDSTYWLIFELMWRDYFRFVCLKYGNAVFYQTGLQGVKIPWKEDWQQFTLWQEGKTGYPLVDANMREIATTGFMSNRGRQNVASFLTKNLGIDWRMGAEWFESLLIDYDVSSNWGNWNYTAGVGNDAREFRYFNIPKQSKMYDPKGNYLRHWLPELRNLPGDLIHEPWKLSSDEQKEYGVTLGVDYPRPVVDFMKSIQANQKLMK